MQKLMVTARANWRRFIAAWLFPLFLVFVYMPLNKEFPNEHGRLWYLFALPVFLASYGWASVPLRTRSIPLSHGIVLVFLVPILLILLSIAIRDGMTQLLG